MKEKLKRLKKLLEDKRGQFTVSNLIMLAVIIIVFSVLLPVIQNFIDDAINTVGAGSRTGIILTAILPILAIGIIWAIVLSGRSPTYEYRR